ncbi:DivIVA domain-containing protein [Microbacterium sp. C7(2022)]|uniref:DivIVA domain-containing protein n=1 Tax=Microbacterium sp. C7(2022) TaxID=2992759 RepID=UPI00237C0931|nr:DivIVA domain-containing protein [Microbacterium sp. C7(2022)]MDE0546920.1 DivIVA domain-containing protein [Microbacterium sp. C7(2022)]
MTTVDSSVSAFPRTRGREKGYRPTDVDDFIARAREAFESGTEPLTAAEIRQVAFPLVKRGYTISAVDAALGRIEDAFAARERDAALAAGSAHEWVTSSRDAAQEVLDRLQRQRGKRFLRVGGLRYGYRIDEVDLVADKLAAFLQTGEGVSVEQVRAVAFRMQRRGYSEAQVDAVLDAVVEVMLAVR